MSEEFYFSYSRKTFPFDPGCYHWPKVEGITTDGEEVLLNAHCIRDMNRKRFMLMGFLGHDHEMQISAVIYMAQKMDAEVIVIRGLGFNDKIVNGLMANMLESEDFPGCKTSLFNPGWPTRFQHKILREAEDIRRYGDFHESSLAYRLHASVEEIHDHLELLTDLGLMESVS